LRKTVYGYATEGGTWMMIYHPLPSSLADCGKNEGRSDSLQDCYGGAAEGGKGKMVSFICRTVLWCGGIAKW
jgi:hypothetical protein